MADVNVTVSDAYRPSGIVNPTYVYVYEDVGGDGTGSDSITIDGTTIEFDNTNFAEVTDGQTEYTLSGFDGSSGNVLYARISTTTTGDPEQTATFTEPIDVSLAVSVPTAPSDLDATATSPTEVDLSWTDNSSDSGQEDEFRVHRTTTASPSFPGDYSQIDMVGADVTTYQDTTAPGGETIHYAVTAWNSAGESSETTASVTTPTLLSASGTGTGTGTAAVVRARPISASGTGAGTGSALVVRVRSLTTSGSGIGTGTAALYVTKFLGGTVTLSDNPVQGAIVTVIDSDEDAVEAVDTTDVNGEWSATVPGDSTYHATVEYEDGSGDQYNDESKPFLVN